MNTEQTSKNIFMDSLLSYGLFVSQQKKLKKISLTSFFRHFFNLLLGYCWLASTDNTISAQRMVILECIFKLLYQTFVLNLFYDFFFFQHLIKNVLLRTEFIKVIFIQSNFGEFACQYIAITILNIQNRRCSYQLLF